MDNANKYCDPEGTVTVRLCQIEERENGLKSHEVSNTYKEGKTADYSRRINNKEHKGFGIGLSMAQSMVKLFKGRILPLIK